MGNRLEKTSKYCSNEATPKENAAQKPGPKHGENSDGRGNKFSDIDREDPTELKDRRPFLANQPIASADTKILTKFACEKGIQAVVALKFNPSRFLCSGQGTEIRLFDWISNETIKTWNSGHSNDITRVFYFLLFYF